jgi:hypothetical protein
MHEAAMQAQIDPDRLSFVHAVCVLQDAIPEFQMIEPDQLAWRYQRLLQDIAATSLESRRERINPRVIKPKQSKFDVKRPEHRHRPKLIGSFREAVALKVETRVRRDDPLGSSIRVNRPCGSACQSPHTGSRCVTVQGIHDKAC